MKKVFVYAFLIVFAFANIAQARVQYDEAGRKIIQDDTIRGRKRAAQTQIQENRKIQAAAAAKIDYAAELEKLENDTNLKNNYYKKEAK